MACAEQTKNLDNTILEHPNTQHLLWTLQKLSNEDLKLQHLDFLQYTRLYTASILQPYDKHL